MKKRRRSKLILLLLLLEMMIIGTIAGSFAYFNISGTSNPIAFLTTITSDRKINIEDFYDLYKYTKAGVYNDIDEVSREDKRNTLVLQTDILMEDDLVVTADVHIDLNGHTLYLCGHTLTFQHGYYGSIVIGNNSDSTATINSANYPLYDNEGHAVLDSDNKQIVVSEAGHIVIDTPHASYVFDNVTYNSASVTVLNMDALQTSYNAFYLAANALVNGEDLRKDRLSYDELVTKGSVTIDDLLVKRDTCKISGESENCVFVNRDIDLPYHYYSEDIKISYKSSEPKIINNYGKLLALPEKEETVTLTMTVSYSDPNAKNDPDNDHSWTKSMDFMIHVVNTSDSETAQKVGETLLKTMLQDLWVESDTYVRYNNTTLFKNYYYFTAGRQLPTTSSDFGITYSYEVLKYDGVNPMATVSNVSGNVYNFEPNKQCFYLLATIKDSSGNTNTYRLPMYCRYATTDEAIVRLMMNDLYGGAVIYDSSKTTKHMYSVSDLKGTTESDLTDTTVAAMTDYLSVYEITDISYKIKGDAAQDYILSGSELSTIDNKEATNYRESAMTVTVTFGSGDSARKTSIDLYIIYLTGTGDTVSGYWPYYNFYNETYVQTALTDSFLMPFAYSADQTSYSAPYTIYDVAYNYKSGTKTINDVETEVYYSGDALTSGLNFAMPDGLTISLVEGDTTYVTLDYSSYTVGSTKTLVSGVSSLGGVFNAYLTAYNKKLSDFNHAWWKFSINVPGLTFEDIDMVLLYNYSFFDTTTGGYADWKPYCASDGTNDYYTNLSCSKVTLEGGLIYASDATGNHIPDANLFVWMYNKFNPSGNAADQITSADNQHFIRNDWLSVDVAIDYPNASPGSVTNWYGIQYMDATTSVDLSGVTMTTDILSYICDMKSVENLALNNCGLTTATFQSAIASASEQLRWKNLSITGNSINTFGFLLDLTDTLNEVSLYNNTGSNTTYYGSTGISNYYIYEDLNRRGIAVYYNLTNNNAPLLYEDTDERNDYQRLKDLEYQSMLSNNVSITKLYEDFATLTSADLNLSTTYTLSWSSTNTYFQVTASAGGYEVICRYYVDRY